MRLLVDTGVLLAATHASHVDHVIVIAALGHLEGDSHTFVCGMQNAAEFWTVTTRPSASRGGLGQSLAVAEQRLLALERWLTVLTESPASYVEWRQLIVQHGVSGVQVHDARLVALMRVERISTLLTRNAKDFVRYPGLTVLTPEQVLSTGGPT